MPPPSVKITFKKAIKDIEVLENYRRDSILLEPKFQHFVAEVILIRLFSIIEHTVRESALKIACNANYRNGLIPNLTVICRSQTDAHDKFSNFNRDKTAQLKWTKASFIHKSIKEVIPVSEQFRIQINNHSILYSEMRKVRNHIAHKTASTYNNYKVILRQVFGAQIKIQTGAFLTSTKRLNNPKIDDYLKGAKIMLNDITGG